MMRPATAALWLEAMRRLGRWLYALPDGTTADGSRRLRLGSNLETERVVESIIVDTPSGQAHIGGKPAWRRRTGIDMSQTEIQAYSNELAVTPITP